MSLVGWVLAGLKIVFAAGAGASFLRSAGAMQRRTALRGKITGAVFVVAWVAVLLVRLLPAGGPDTPWPLAVGIAAVFLLVTSLMGWLIVRWVRELRATPVGD